MEIVLSSYWRYNLTFRNINVFYLLAVGVEREEGVFVHGGGEVRDLWFGRS